MLTWIEDFAPYGVITTDREFKIQSWNRWMESHSGKPSAAAVGCDLFTLFPELAGRGLQGRFRRALEGEVSVLSTALHRYLITLPLAAGESGFTEMQQTARIAPLTHNGEIVGSIIVIEDVTQREFQALTMRRQHERDNILSWALAHLLEANEPRRSIRELFWKIAEEFDFDSYLFFLCPHDGGNMKLNAAGGISPELETRFAILDEADPLSRRLLNTRQARSLENLPALQTEDALWHSVFGFRACLLLPLSAGNEREGILCFGTRTRESLSKDELELLTTIGQYLAMSVAKEATNLKLHAAQVQLSRHAQDLEHQVSDRTARLREIIAEQETFAHTVAHDLRAPIRALTGYCEMLMEDFALQMPAEAKDIIARLSAACQRLDLLTNDILEFSQVSRQEIHLAPVHLDALVSDTLSLRGVEPGVIEVRRPLHPVLAQRTLLEQCLANLIDNALKFVPAGACAKVSIFTEQSKAGKVRIVVQDNGIGIAPNAQRKIFGIFERGTSSNLYRGSGIGLAIVDRALQRMGGACGVESELGAGSRFWLELPAATIP